MKAVQQTEEEMALAVLDRKIETYRLLMERAQEMRGRLFMLFYPDAMVEARVNEKNSQSAADLESLGQVCSFEDFIAGMKGWFTPPQAAEFAREKKFKISNINEALNLRVESGLLVKRRTASGKRWEYCLASAAEAKPAPPPAPAKAPASRSILSLEQKPPATEPVPRKTAQQMKAIGSLLEDLGKSIEDVTPLSVEGIQIGRECFPETFTLTDAQARIGRKASEWLARWKGQGWIDTVGNFQYRRNEKFGS